ncbi:hypothetical protein GIB67_037385 [Kingdonia uniflora]|uniref:Enoyl reductase (ER) domain-containing protein n=1 Tax=Kingdonia uniflora TaxID=39325 RepID=A0A7J7M8F9_9MAGN|nr:hypothetical protein GIB67_037385 [Kingdonia uniflora]
MIWEFQTEYLVLVVAVVPTVAAACITTVAESGFSNWGNTQARTKNITRINMSQTGGTNGPEPAIPRNGPEPAVAKRITLRNRMHPTIRSKFRMEVTYRYITMKHHIEGAPVESDFELKSASHVLLVNDESNDVLVKNLYISIDPYQLNRMKKYSSSQKGNSFSVGVAPGQAIDAYGIGRVVASANKGFAKDDIVVGVIGWEDYSLSKGGNMLRKLETSEFPLSYQAGILGLSGLTAYAGFYDICKPKKGDKVFVSTASGSVGNLVGQYAKLFGCYVVGCAGTKQKVDMLKEKLGFDDAFNYKEGSDMRSTLKRYFPEGIDIYFDNVGGEMLEAAVANMNPFGRVAVCGVISEYTDSRKRAGPDMLDVIYKRIKIQGFLAADHYHLYGDFISTTSDYIRSGKIHILEDISHGIESVTSAFQGLFRGDNVGKKLVQITEE